MTFIGAIAELWDCVLPEPTGAGATIEWFAGAVFTLSFCTGAVVWAAAAMASKPNEAAIEAYGIWWRIMNLTPVSFCDLPR
jgi:hypothetical protein